MLIAVWLLALVVSLLFSQPKPFAVAIVAAGIGAIAGALQFRAITATAPQLVAANTALQVRQVLQSNASGKYSIYLLWAFSGTLVALAFGGQLGTALPVMVAGYSAFALLREAVSLPALLKLPSS